MGWGLKGRGTQFKNCKKCDYVLNKKACILKACNIYTAAGFRFSSTTNFVSSYLWYRWKMQKKRKPRGGDYSEVKTKIFPKKCIKEA